MSADPFCTCTSICAPCLAVENYLEWLASQHNSLEDQARWPQLVRTYGYALPIDVWEQVEAYLAAALQDWAEEAERRAGWDASP